MGLLLYNPCMYQALFGLGLQKLEATDAALFWLGPILPWRWIGVALESPCDSWLKNLGSRWFFSLLNYPYSIAYYAHCQHITQDFFSESLKPLQGLGFSDLFFLILLGILIAKLNFFILFIS